LNAFEEIYKTYFPRVYTFLYRLCQNSSLTEELTQESFYQAYCSFHRFKGKCDIFTWLAAIAKHVYYRYLRRHKAEMDVLSLSSVVDAYCDNPADIHQRKTLARAAAKMLKKVPEKYSDVVILRVYAEMSFSEISALLEISENSAKVIYYRAKKMLMEELDHAHYL
jgi:RNA polymerase sigma factor (sigma-70 family)